MKNSFVKIISIFVRAKPPERPSNHVHLPQRGGGRQSCRHRRSICYPPPPRHIVSGDHCSTRNAPSFSAIGANLVRAQVVGGVVLLGIVAGVFYYGFGGASGAAASTAAAAQSRAPHLIRVLSHPTLPRGTICRDVMPSAPRVC